MPGITPIADVPDAPTIGTATVSGTTASVPFTAAVTGGTPTSYTATSTPGSITGTSATSPISVSGLTGGTAYTFKVKGTNSTATGAESSASNSVTATSTYYEQIATYRFPNSTTGTYTFSSIPSGYSSLQIRYSAKITATGNTNASLVMYLNNDSTAGNYKYGYKRMYAITNTDGYFDGGYNSASGTYIFANVQGSYSGVNAANFMPGIVDIYNYSSNSLGKSASVFCGGSYNGNYGGSYDSGILGYEWFYWTQTSPVTSIRVDAGSSSNFVQNSIISIYGVKS